MISILWIFLLHSKHLQFDIPISEIFLMRYKYYAKIPSVVSKLPNINSYAKLSNVSSILYITLLEYSFIIGLFIYSKITSFRQLNLRTNLYLQSVFCKTVEISKIISCNAEVTVWCLCDIALDMFNIRSNKSSQFDCYQIFII